MLLTWSEGDTSVRVDMEGISTRNKISAALHAIASHAGAGGRVVPADGPYSWDLEFSEAWEAKDCYYMLIAIAELPMPDDYNPLHDPDNYYVD